MFSKIYKVFLIISVSSLILRLFHLQILKGNYFYDMSMNNYLRVLPLPGYRGNILDCYGRELAANKLTFAIQVLPDRLKDKEEVFEIVAAEFNFPLDEIKNIYKNRFKAPFFPLTLVSDVDIKKALYLKEKYRDVSGFLVAEEIVRFYPQHSVASHVLGYLGEISQDELNMLKPYGYRYSSLIGKSGVEKEQEAYLKGNDGGMLVKVDNRGRVVEVLNREIPQRGLDVYLTIDLSLQKKAEEILGGETGCFLVMNVKNGEILVLASSPTFDPNTFLTSDKEVISAILKQKSNPLFNRSIQAQYPLGSIFKLLIAIAGQESGKIKTNTSFTCPGYFEYGGRKYKCWKEYGHGIQALRAAIAHSCNFYFYQAGLAVGIADIVDYSHVFGFGDKSGIDLPYEAAGFLPDPKWKLKKLKENWYPGDTINLAIGQGYLEVTPIQTLRFIAAIANGGDLFMPVVCKSVSGENMNGKKAKKLPIDEKNLKYIRSAMKDVVNDPTGTGQMAKLNNVVISAKTATAQVTKGASNAWFTGFAPHDDPEIAFLVMVEHGGGGGFITARMAKEFLQYYFSDLKK